MKTGLFNNKGKKVKEIELESSVFDIKANVGVVHQVVTAQRGAARSGNASTKTRSEVRGGGTKPWRQKGTGRARAGSIRSPLWKGGGTTFGPTPRDFSKKVPKKMGKLALRSVLSSKAKNDNLVVIDEFGLKKPATKEAAKILSGLKIQGRATIVISNDDVAAQKSIRNLPDARAISVSELNLYDLVDCAKLVITKDALEKVTEVLKDVKS